MCDLAQPFAPYPRLSPVHDDFKVYREFRPLEPELVAYHDRLAQTERVDFGVLSIRAGESTLGVGSYVAEANKQKPRPANRYARIDVIIVNPGFRGLGVGRAVILCVAIHLLETYGTRLYSISTLAAHPAVERVVEQLGFLPQRREHDGFTRESLELTGRDAAALAREYRQRLEAGLQALNYRLRQQEEQA